MTVRAIALKWLAIHHQVDTGRIITSRLYPPNESWTGGDAWWIQIPMVALERNEEIHLVCQRELDGDDFHYLRVPPQFLRDHVDDFALVRDTHISLFLDAGDQPFTDVRGPGRVSFAPYLIGDSPAREARGRPASYRPSALEGQLMPSVAVHIDVRELLAFFDEEAKGSARHASAIVGVAGEDLGAALLADYLRSQGIAAEILPHRCTQGTKKGFRLDRWVLTHPPAGDLLYQVEIKNWSAHAIGGRKLAQSASPSAVREYKIERWSKEWNGTSFRKAQVAKVLTPMKSPRPSLPVEPLVCFWTALHPEGAESPFFSVPLTDHAVFRRVSVFSMSSYLRALSSPSITLSMPEVAVRRGWLARLFPDGVNAAAV